MPRHRREKPLHRGLVPAIAGIARALALALGPEGSHAWMFAALTFKLVGSRDSEVDSCTNCEEPGDISPVTRSHCPLVSSLPFPLITVAPSRRRLVFGEKEVIDLVLEVVGAKQTATAR